MNVLVTGGGGFLGTEICKILLKNNYKVFNFSRNSYPHLDELGVETRKGDIRNLAQVFSALVGIDVIIHTAAVADIWGKKSDFYSINLDGTLNLLNAAKESGIKKFIYTSSPSVIFGNRDLCNINEDIKYPENHFCDYAA